MHSVGQRHTSIIAIIIHFHTSILSNDQQMKIYIASKFLSTIQQSYTHFTIIIIATGDTSIYICSHMFQLKIKRAIETFRVERNWSSNNHTTFFINQFDIILIVDNCLCTNWHISVRKRTKNKNKYKMKKRIYLYSVFCMNMLKTSKHLWRLLRASAS